MNRHWKSYQWFTLGIALIVGAALLAAPSPASARGTEGQSHPDTWLTAKTKIALFADGRVKGRQVEVETHKGKVMLRGKVETSEAKAAAAEIAKGIEGVKDVKNELQVVPPSKREDVDVKDDALTMRIKDALKKEPKFKKANIDVQTNAGVVSLSGDVPDITTSAYASWTAWIVPGVKAVKNDLVVKEKAGS